MAVTVVAVAMAVAAVHYLLLLLPSLTRTTSRSSMGVVSCASSISKHEHNNDHLHYPLLLPPPLTHTTSRSSMKHGHNRFRGYSTGVLH